MCPSARDHATQKNTAGLRPAFDALDADRDGKISPDDLKTLSIISEGDISAMMAAADADRNGYVEFEEFEEVLVGGGRGRSGAKGLMEEVFRAMDRDGDGKVGFWDLKGYLAEVVGMPVGDDEVRTMIDMGGGAGNSGVGFDALMQILTVGSAARCT